MGRKLKALPCPFCGQAPEIGPKEPEREGGAWGVVKCVNQQCSTYTVARACGVFVLDGEDVCDERGTEAYQQAAIRRWNQRF